MNKSPIASPNFLTITLRVLSVLEIPIHIFGFYCILFKTPKSLNSVKWCLLNLHFWSVFLDLLFSVLVCPFFIIPVIGGYTLGSFSILGVPAIVQFYAIVTTFLAVGGSIVSIVENRYFILFARNTRWQSVRHPFLFLNYLLVFTFYIPPLYHVPDQDYATSLVQKNYSQIPISSFNIGPLFVLTFDTLSMTITMFLSDVIFVVEIIVFNKLLFGGLKKRIHRTELSSRTYEMQRKFLIAIVIQISIPMVLLLIPAVYFEFASFFAYYNQAFNNLIVTLVSLHGSTSTIVMLFIHEPYRLFCFKLFRRSRGEVDSSLTTYQ